MRTLVLAALLAGPAAAGTVVPGPLDLEVKSEVYHQSVLGDGARSFLRSGTYYLNRASALLDRKGPGLTTVSGQLDLQQSDDPLVDGGKGRYRALGGYLALERAQRWRLEAGNILPKASKATLTALVTGLGGYLQSNAPGRLARLSLIAGQLAPPLDGVRFSQGVAGVSLTGMRSGWLGSGKLMGHLYRISDIKGSIPHGNGLTRRDVTVGSLSADLKAKDGLGLSGELAALRSEDGSAAGSSLRLSPSYSSELMTVKAGFERDSPRFLNPAASAAADLKRVDGSLAVGKVQQLTFDALYTQNNVEGNLSSTTRTQVAGLSGKAVPFPDDELWNGLALTADHHFNRSSVSDGSLEVENRTTGLSVLFEGRGLRGELRGEFQPTRDARDASNDRDVYRARWDASVRLRGAGLLRLTPSWSLLVERTRNLATGLTDQGGAASGGLAATYGPLSAEARHEFQQTVVKPSGRKARNESSSASGSWSFKAWEVPCTLKVSGFHKHYYDTALNAFTEQEIRGGLDARF